MVYDQRNSLLDFSPMNQGIQAYRKGMDEERQGNLNRDIGNSLMRKDYDGAASAAAQGGDIQTSLGITKFQADRTTQELQQRHMQIDRIGKMAQAAMEEPDPVRRQQMHEAILKQHPDGSHEDIYADPNVGLKMLAAESGHVKTDIERQIQQAQLNNLNMQTVTAHNADNRAKMQLEEDQKLNSLMSGLTNRTQQGAAQPASPSLPQTVPSQGQAIPQPAAPSLKPMSYGGNDPQGGGDPNLIQIADGAPAQSAQQQAPKAEPKMVTTPMGQMSVEDANQMGMLWARKKNHDLAKQFFEAAKSGVEATGLGKEGGNQNDKAQLGYVNHLSRLGEMEKSINDKFLQFGPRLKMYGDALAEKFGSKLSPEREKMLGEYAQFRSEAVTNFNLLLKEASGTAVTESELKRMQLQEPNAGMGVFDGDNVTDFKAKLAQGKKGLQLAIARANYLRANGFQGTPYDGKITDEIASKVPLGSMERIMDQQGTKLHQQIQAQNPNASQKQIQGAVTDALRRQFGLDL